jgi:hypothetical protein
MAASMKMTVFWDVVPCKRLPDYTVQHPRRQPSSGFVCYYSIKYYNCLIYFPKLNYFIHYMYAFEVQCHAGEQYKHQVF